MDGAAAAIGGGGIDHGRAARHCGNGSLRPTGGNPFFVTEALAAPTEDVPTTVRLAVLARAARLEPPARAVLDAVAIVPGRAESWLVMRETPASRRAGAIDRAYRAGMLVADNGTYTFRHELARRRIEGPGRRAPTTVHRGHCAALHGHGQVDPARLAHHAAPAGDDAALARFSRDACLVGGHARPTRRRCSTVSTRSRAQRPPADDVAELKVTVCVPADHDGSRRGGWRRSSARPSLTGAAAATISAKPRPSSR